MTPEGSSYPLVKSENWRGVIYYRHMQHLFILLIQVSRGVPQHKSAKPIPHSLNIHTSIPWPYEVLQYMSMWIIWCTQMPHPNWGISTQIVEIKWLLCSTARRVGIPWVLECGLPSKSIPSVIAVAWRETEFWEEEQGYPSSSESEELCQYRL